LLYPRHSEKVHYATAERFYSHWKLREKDDTGTLSMTGKRLQFDGKRHSFETREIKQLWTAKAVPNLASIIFAPVLAVMIYYAAGLLIYFIGLLFDKKLDILLKFDLKTFVWAFIGEFGAVFRAVISPEKWIYVEYTGEYGRRREAFFRRASRRSPRVLFNQLKNLTAK
jgi:hypothetical protein